MGPLQHLTLVLAGQHPEGPMGPPAPSDIALAAANGAGDDNTWMWLTAVITLSTVVSALFTLLLKSYKDKNEATAEYAKKIDQIHEQYREAAEAKSKRISEEMQKKDANLFEWATKVSTTMANVGNALAENNVSEDMAKLKADNTEIKQLLNNLPNLLTRRG